MIITRGSIRSYIMKLHIEECYCGDPIFERHGVSFPSAVFRASGGALSCANTPVIFYLIYLHGLRVCSLVNDASEGGDSNTNHVD